MLIGLIRPTDTRTLHAEGTSMGDVDEKLAAQTPPGWESLDRKLTMKPGGGPVTATATIGRRDELAEIEADTLDTLRARVPEGWQLMWVRSA